jgi:hypothetical protein
MWFPVTRGFMSDRLGGAENFMNVYNKVGPHLKVPTVGNLQVEFRTLYLIAAQKTPEPVRVEALRRDAQNRAQARLPHRHGACGGAVGVVVGAVVRPRLNFVRTKTGRIPPSFRIAPRGVCQCVCWPAGAIRRFRLLREFHPTPQFAALCVSPFPLRE